MHTLNIQRLLDKVFGVKSTFIILSPCCVMFVHLQGELALIVIEVKRGSGTYERKKYLYVDSNE